MKKIQASFLVLGLVALLLAGCSGGGDAAEGETAAAPQETYEWIVQSCFPSSLPLTERTIGIWADMVNEMANGQLQVTLHGAGEIVGGAEVFDAVRDGALDAALNTPAYQRGEYPASDLFYTLPGGVTEFHDLFVWVWGYGGRELEQEMYGDAVVVFPLGLTPPEEIWTNRPINALEDFAGLRIRSAGLAMDLFEDLDASPVLLGGGDVVPSLQRGVIDATEFAFPSMDVALGLPEVASYVIGPPVHMGSNKFQLIINPDRWAELPAHLQSIVQVAATAATFEGYAQEWVETMAAFDEMRANPNLTITKLSPELQAQARAMSFDILERKSAEDEFFGRVWASQREFLESFEPYDELSSFDN